MGGGCVFLLATSHTPYNAQGVECSQIGGGCSRVEQGGSGSRDGHVTPRRYRTVMGRTHSLSGGHVTDSRAH
eukprot:1519401-Rhodomonas_salina.1